MHTLAQRGQIIGAYLACRSMRQVSRLLHLPYSTVRRWVQRSVEMGTVVRSFGSGRPRQTSKRSDRRLFIMARSHPASTVRELLRDWGEAVSKTTVRRRLKEYRLRKYRMHCVPFLTQGHKHARLDWAMRRCHWRQQWASIIWFNESRFLLNPVDRRRQVWRLRGERNQERFMREIRHSGGGSVHVWGAIWTGGRSELMRLDGAVNMISFADLLHQFFTTTNDLPVNAILQLDNAPAHRGWVTRQMLDDLGVQALPWPANSPDLNPIEHAWDILGRRVQMQHPSTLDQLFEALREEWHQIPQQQLDRLIASMPHRIGSVIETRGGHSQY